MAWFIQPGDYLLVAGLIFTTKLIQAEDESKLVSMNQPQDVA
jgi:hypothetical protein